MTPSDPDPRPTDRAGPYELIEELGRGGMGIVYLARRADGQFQKRVAVKLIRTGMDSEEILARFEREQQVLASLEHPGIARLIDGGLDDEGHPFLVMELVEGVPIDRWCEERELSLDERLQLFRQVCAAVDSAHRSLVVHRDLKPGNILVTSDGQPKLLDFGIAKVLADAGEEAHGEVTRTDSRQLTPEYASPEQVRGDPITTATDVYSLGVILYQLLVGRRPLLPDESSAGAMERAICEEEPPAPSTVQSLPRGLRRKLAGDLDLVALKALRKEPDRRYRSAAELAADLQRFSTGLPVEARPDTWGYRAERFTRRNPVAVGTVTLVVIALIVGLVFSTYQYGRASEAQERIADQLEVDQERTEQLRLLTVTLEESRQRLVNQRGLAESRAEELELLNEELQQETELAEHERQRAESSVEELQRVNTELASESELARERYRDAWSMARAMVFDIHDGLARARGASRAMELVANLGVALLDELAANAEVHPALQQDLVNGYLRLAATLGDIAGPSRGRGARALELLEKAVAIAEELHSKDETDLKRIYDLAAALNSRGIILSQRGQASRAAEDFQRGVELCAGFDDEVPRHPRRIYLLCLATRNLAQTQLVGGRYEEGLATLESCVELMEFCAEQDPERAYQLHQLLTSIAAASSRLRGPEATIPVLERGLELFTELVREHPGDAVYRREAGALQLNLSRHYADVGRLPEAVELALDQVQEMRGTIELDPGDAGARLNGMHALVHLGELLARQGRWEELTPCAREGLELAEGLAQLDPGNVRILEMLGQFLIQLGRAEFEQGRAAESEQLLARAMREAEELLELRPSHHSLHVLLYSARANFAQLCRHVAEDEEEPLERRIESCRESIEYFRRARQQIEGTSGDVTVFGDRKLLLQRLQRDEGGVTDYLMRLEGTDSSSDEEN